MRLIMQCQRCGKVAPADPRERAWWLCGLRKDGRGVIIRCPECTTGYARRQVDRDYELKS